MSFRMILKWAALVILILWAAVCFFLSFCEVAEGATISMKSFICIKIVAFVNTAALWWVAKKMKNAGYLPSMDDEHVVTGFRKGGDNE